jgi:hypothetical protein
VKPGPRLAAFLSCVVVGAGFAVIGAATAWYKTIAPTQSIGSPLGTVRVRGAVHSFSPADLGSPLLPIALLCLVFGLLAFLVGPRARTLLVGLVLVGALSLIPLSFVVHKPAAGNARVESVAGRIVAPIGAVVALAGAAAALPLSAQVRRVRMPETGPQEEQ